MRYVFFVMMSFFLVGCSSNFSPPSPDYKAKDINVKSMKKKFNELAIEYGIEKRVGIHVPGSFQNNCFSNNGLTEKNIGFELLFRTNGYYGVKSYDGLNHRKVNYILKPILKCETIWYESKSGEAEGEFGKGKGTTDTSINLDTGSNIVNMTLTLGLIDSFSSEVVRTYERTLPVKKYTKSNGITFFVVGNGVSAAMSTSVQEAKSVAFNALIDIMLVEVYGNLLELPYQKIDPSLYTENKDYKKRFYRYTNKFITNKYHAYEILGNEFERFNLWSSNIFDKTKLADINYLMRVLKTHYGKVDTEVFYKLSLESSNNRSDLSEDLKVLKKLYIDNIHLNSHSNDIHFKYQSIHQQCYSLVQYMKKGVVKNDELEYLSRDVLKKSKTRLFSDRKLFTKYNRFNIPVEYSVYRKDASTITCRVGVSNKRGKNRKLYRYFHFIKENDLIKLSRYTRNG